MSLLGDWDEIFEKHIKKLNEFQHIDRFDEIISILTGLRSDEFFGVILGKHWVFCVVVALLTMVEIL
ncbi:MAG: hypothetical protein FWE58_05000 [Methanobrevibacter sp.]|nr:hypothetical protein [Methanobrevibacter sp.]